MNLGVQNVAEEIVVDGGATAERTIAGLSPFTNHTVTVVTHNGVSDQDAINMAQRQALVRGATAEGSK